MSLYLKIILVVFGLAYFISPVDIIPDLLLPYFGFIDDGVVIATLLYLIRTGHLPNLSFYKKKTTFTHKTKTGKSHQSEETGKEGQESHAHSREHHKMSPLSAHEILDVPADATKKQVQEAYKTAIKKYHPDKLSHLGEEFSNLANEKFVQIQTAYDELMKKF